MQRNQEIRCFCARKPRLGLLVEDESGAVYFHVKAYKAQRVIAEVRIFGSFEIMCRDCRRWHRVTLDAKGVKIENMASPIPVVDATATVQLVSDTR